MRTLIKLRFHGYDFKVRMSRKYLAVYYVQKNTVCITRQILRPRSLIETLTKRDQQTGVPVSQLEQETPPRELLKDMAQNYMAVSEEEIKEMTREYCSRIKAYRTKLMKEPQSSMVEESRPVTNLKRVKDMVPKIREGHGEHVKRFQSLENTTLQEEEQSTREVEANKDIMQDYEKRIEGYMKQLQTLENSVPKWNEENVNTSKEKNTEKKEKNVMQEFRKQNEEYMKQLQSEENSVTQGDEENVKTQTIALKEKTRKKEEDVIQEYRKQNIEYMKQLQTLQNTVPQEDNEKKTAKKGEEEMDRDVMQEYRKQNEEYLKQLQALQNTVPQEDEEYVEVYTSANKERKTAAKVEIEEMPIKPKRPSTAYMLFVKDCMANLSGSRKGAFKKIAEEWKTLTAEQKQVYDAEAVDLKTSYERELHQWELEMIKQKNFSVIRRTTLKKVL